MFKMKNKLILFKNKMFLNNSSSSDPTLKLVSISLDEPFFKVLTEEDYPIFYKSEDIIRDEDIEIIKGSIEDIQPVYVDETKYNELSKLKDNFSKYDKSKYSEARNIANPFEKMGYGCLGTRAALKMCNIDAVYNVLGRIGGLVSKQSFDHISFCDIAGGPGGFTQYIQWRFPQSQGFGISLKLKDEKEQALNWDLSMIDESRFKIINGSDGTGDLYKNYQEFADIVRDQYPNGVDICVSDGGFDVEDSSTLQEKLSSRLIGDEMLTGLLCLKQGGNLVVKLFDTVTKISGEQIFVTASCFDKVSIIKPVSSRPANAERYIVFQGFNVDKSMIPIKILKMANDLYEDNVFVTKLLKENVIPSKFEEWLISTNESSMELQEKTTKNILSLLENNKVEYDIPVLDIERCFLVWKLPQFKFITRRKFLGQNREILKDFL
jgi:cap1 methyltransferase